MLFVGSYADNNSINADNDSLKDYKTSFFSLNKKKKLIEIRWVVL